MAIVGSLEANGYKILNIIKYTKENTIPQWDWNLVTLYPGTTLRLRKIGVLCKGPIFP